MTYRFSRQLLSCAIVVSQGNRPLSHRAMKLMVPVSVSGYVLLVLAIGWHRGINMIDCCMFVVCVVCKCVHECMYMCVQARWCVSMHACLCARVCVPLCMWLGIPVLV